MARIRVTGTPADVEATLTALRGALAVTAISRRYPQRPRPGRECSEFVRVYLHTTPPTEGTAR